MCGRFALTAPASAIAEIFQVDVLPEVLPRYNVAPSQQIAALVRQEDGTRQMTTFRWGLIPSWAKDPKIAYKMINARSETAASKPAFRAALKRRRCLILADGFYEWTRRSKTDKVPHLIQLDDGRPFAMAGNWERWVSPEGDDVRSAAILTTGPNELMEPIHNRMPVILPTENEADWLDPETSKEALQELLVPFDASSMKERIVTKRVNNARHEGADVQGPPEEEEA